MEERSRRPQLILVCRSRGSFDASPPSPRCAERMPEPTAEVEPEPATTDEPSPLGATVLRIDAEPEPLTSVKVREPATVSATWENVADSESVDKSSVPCIVAEGERIKQLGLLDIEEDLIDWETDLEVELAPLHSPFPPLVPSRSPLPPLVPSSSPLPPRFQSSSHSSPLLPSRSALAERPPVPAPRQRPPVPAPRKCSQVSPLVPSSTPERPRESAPTRVSATRAPTRASRAPPKVGPVQLTIASAGPVQLTLAHAGPVQLTWASAGPVQLTLASADPVQLTLASAGPVQRPFCASRAPPRFRATQVPARVCASRAPPRVVTLF